MKKIMDIEGKYNDGPNGWYLLLNFYLLATHQPFVSSYYVDDLIKLGIHISSLTWTKIDFLAWSCLILTKSSKGV